MEFKRKLAAKLTFTKVLPTLFLTVLGGLTLVQSVYSQIDPLSDEEALFDIYGDEEIISIATGSLQPIAQAPAVATVITADQIQAMGASDIDQVLETVPGLHVTREPYGMRPAYVFRGIFAPTNAEVLLLINGIPLTNLFQGDRNLVWGGMPVNGISRIEVIRGPGSAVYGADAFAGVINIITKKGSEIGVLESGIRYGSFNTKEAWVMSGSNLGGGEFAVMVEALETDGADEIVELDAQSTFDQLSSTNVSYAPGAMNTSRRNLDIRLDYQLDHWQFRAGLQKRSDFGSGVGIAQSLDPEGRYGSNRWNADITYATSDWWQDWDITAQLSILNTSQVSERNIFLAPEGADFGLAGTTFPEGVIGNPEVFERHSRFSLSAFYEGIDRHQLRLGLGYYYGDVYKTKETKNFNFDPVFGVPIYLGSELVDVSDTEEVFLPEVQRINRFVFIQDVWNFAADWEFTMGVRYDDYSDFGSTINPRLALVWATNHNLTTKILYGQAFRSPSFAQLLVTNNPVAQGNSELAPETLETVELAFNYRISDTLMLNNNYFYYEWDDIIVYVPDQTASTGTAQNASQQTGLGTELELDWQPLSNVRLAANYAWQKSKDEATDKPVAQSPEHQVYASLLWKITPQWQFYSQFNVVMERHRDVNDQRSSVKDYETVDVTLRKLFNGSGFQAAVSVRNLFDVTAVEPSPLTEPFVRIPNDLPLPGRSFQVEFRYDLP